jgi:hypothetical protein
MTVERGDDKPIFPDGYLDWLKDTFDLTINTKIKQHYSALTLRIKQDWATSPLWKDLLATAKDANDSFYSKTGYPLIYGEFRPPEIVVKPFDSALEKSYRKNVLLNSNWPDPPPTGTWVLPHNWFSHLNDIVRTTLVVKYLDGVPYLSAALEGACQQQGVETRVDMEAKEEGYYAAHFYVLRSLSLFDSSFNEVTENTSFEIQITTQLQEVISRLLHKQYETSRIRRRQTEVKWQWDFQSEQFKVNYLGHILHYLEGLITDVRR